MAITEYGSDTTFQKLEGKNWMATMMSCWAFGTFGAHRFYTGKQVTAWIMFALTFSCCLAPISVIWTLIDGVMIALGKFTHADGSELYERIDWVGYLYIGIVVLSIIGAAAYFALFVASMGAMLGGLETPTP